MSATCPWNTALILRKTAGQQNNAHLKNLGETLQKENENHKAMLQVFLERRHGLEAEITKEDKLTVKTPCKERPPPWPG